MSGVSSAAIISGAGRRVAFDFYPTPPEVTKALICQWEFRRDAIVWEPAVGNGAMADVLDEYFTEPVVRSDIQTGTDYLKTPTKLCNWIITNPPFSLAAEFIDRAIETHLRPKLIAPGGVAFLLKSTYWHAKSRLDLFNRYPPSGVMPLTWRPDFMDRGAPTMEFMWVVWELYPEREGTDYFPISKPS